MIRILTLGLVVTTIVLVAYTAITLYDDNLSVGRMWETPAVRPHEKPILAMASGLVPTSDGEIQYRMAPPETLISPYGDTPPATVVSTGKVLYGRFCQQCHGINYDGKGTVGQSFAPLPGDLRSAKVQQTLDGVLFKEISYGIPKGRQPALATTISPPDRWRILAFVKSLGTRD
jgi:mono/diheme cytochrome c family protein